MKILVLSHRFYPDVGGIEVNSEVLSAGLQQFGHQVHLVTWTVQKGNRTFPFKVIRNPDKLTLLKEHLWADLVFENNLCLRLSWPRIFIKKPAVVALRTWISRVNGNIGWQDRLKQIWLKRASAVIAVSDAVRAKCFTDAVVIGNPYRAELFKSNSTDQCRNDDFVFLGRLVSDKGADLAIQAFAEFIKQINQRPEDKPSSLTIVGDGPDAGMLGKMVRKLNLTTNVRFEGVLKGKELVRCLNRHRFMLVPSIWKEPFGNVALEGIACGLIPIVSDGGGLPDAVGNAGVSFRSGDVESLVSQMLSLYNDQQKRTLLRHNAQQHLRDHQPLVVTARYLEVFKSVVNP